MIEEWRVVDEAPKFLVSNKGRVKNTITGRLLKIVLAKGYPTVNLTNEGLYFKRRVHRLVASAFVEGGKPGLIVKPIDGNKHNMAPSNLKWITRSENTTELVKQGVIRKLRSWEVSKITGELVERK